MLKRRSSQKSLTRKAQRNRLQSEVLESRRLLAGLEVVPIPFIQESPEIPHPVHEEGQITLKAIARGTDSSGDYEIWWDTDFDGNFDNNPSRIVNATAGTDTIYDIGQTFQVPDVDYDQQLDVQVRIRELDSGDEAFGTFSIYVNDFRPSNDPRNWTDSQLEVIQQMSVQESLWYVHRNLTRSGDLTASMTADYAYDNANPQAAKLFLTNAHLPAYAPGSFDAFGQSTPSGFEAANDARWHADPYAESAMRLLNEVTSSAMIVGISSADEGNQSGFDFNGNPITVNRIPGTTDNFGVRFAGDYAVFDSGQVAAHATALSAVALSLPALAGTPIQLGDAAGESWEWVTQQGVDWLGFAQTDSGVGRGAWGYSANATNLFGADTLKWAVTALSDVEQAGGVYGVVVDNLHKFRVADAILGHANSNGLAEHFIGLSSGDFMHTGTMIQAARWLNAHQFSPGDGQTAFPGISSATRAQLRQTYERFISGAASYWNAVNKRSYYNAFDSFWINGSYLQGNTNTLYNASSAGSPLNMLRYADGLRQGLPESTMLGTHDWNREFTTFLSRGQKRNLDKTDPSSGYDIFGSFTVTNPAIDNYSSSTPWQSILAGQVMTTSLTNPPKYGTIELPLQADTGQSLEFSLDTAPEFLTIQWDFDASNGLSWDTTGTPDATGATVNYNFASPGNYTITARGIFSDGTTYLYTRTLFVQSNAPPVAEDDSIATDQNTPVMFDVLVDNGSGADQDLDGNLDPSLTKLLTDPARGLLTQQADGNFTFDPNGEFDDLPMGQSTSVSFEYQIEDTEGVTATATATILIVGTNDTAIIDGMLDGMTDEDAVSAITGTATVWDVDTGESQFAAQASTPGTYGTFSIDVTGNWSYLVDNASVQDLSAVGWVMESFNISSLDGTTSQVTVKITGNNDAAVIAGTLSGSTDEDAVAALTGTATVTDVDFGEDSFVSQAATVGTYGTFTIDANGDWTFTVDQASVQHLSATDTVTDSYTIASVDGTTSAVAIQIAGQNDPPNVSITAFSALQNAGSPIVVFTSVSDVDGDDNAIALSYKIYIDGDTSPALVGNPTDQTRFLFTPPVAGEYRIELTATDENNAESTTEATITVGPASIVSFLFSDDGAVPGEVNNNGPGAEEYFHEWQDAPGQLWMTISTDVPSGPFALSFQLESTDNWFAEPQLTAHLGTGNTWHHSQDGGTQRTSGTLIGLDLSGYQVGDRVLLATIDYPDDPADPAGLLMDNSGEYVSPTSEHGVQITSASVSQSGQSFAIDTEVPGQFVPVIYDANDDGKVGLGDFARFISQYGRTVDANNPEAYKFDYNWDGKVGLSDFAYFIRQYGRRKDNPSASIIFPEQAPWLQPPAAAKSPAAAAKPLQLEAEPVTAAIEQPVIEPSISFTTSSDRDPGESQLVWGFPPIASSSSPEEISDDIAATWETEPAPAAFFEESSLDPKVVDAVYQEAALLTSDTSSTEEEDADLYQLLSDA